MKIKYSHLYKNSLFLAVGLFLAVLAFHRTCKAELPEKIINPHLIVYKAKRQMELYSENKLIKTYPIGLGLNPVSPKKQQGDYATPEGEYRICRKNPHSVYYMALILNYPNADDADRGLKEKLISKKEHVAIIKAINEKKCPNFYTKLGGLIEIHGMGSKIDWTWGCIALNNADMDDIYPIIPNGARVTVKP